MRDKNLPVRLSNEVLEKVRVQAASHGVTMSALAAWVIGDWILNQEKVGPMMEALAKQMGERIGDGGEESKPGSL
jgi:plasmid stability protein